MTSAPEEKRRDAHERTQDVPPRRAMEEAGAERHAPEEEESIQHTAMDHAVHGRDVDHRHPADAEVEEGLDAPRAFEPDHVHPGEHAGHPEHAGHGEHVQPDEHRTHATESEHAGHGEPTAPDEHWGTRWIWAMPVTRRPETTRRT